MLDFATMNEQEFNIIYESVLKEHMRRYECHKITEIVTQIEKRGFYIENPSERDLKGYVSGKLSVPLETLIPNNDYRTIQPPGVVYGNVNEIFEAYLPPVENLTNCNSNSATLTIWFKPFSRKTTEGEAFDLRKEQIVTFSQKGEMYEYTLYGISSTNVDMCLFSLTTEEHYGNLEFLVPL